MIRQKIFQAIVTGILPFWLLSVPGQVLGNSSRHSGFTD